MLMYPMKAFEQTAGSGHSGSLFAKKWWQDDGPGRTASAGAPLGGCSSNPILQIAEALPFGVGVILEWASPHIKRHARTTRANTPGLAWAGEGHEAIRPSCSTGLSMCTQHRRGCCYFGPHGHNSCEEAFILSVTITSSSTNIHNEGRQVDR